MAVTGGCLCGKVRYSIDAEVPMVVRACWCRVCQYLGAGSGTVNAVFPKANMQLTGALGVHDGIADSGAHMHRSFCPSCGTALFSEADERPLAIVVRVGSLDEPKRFAPQMTIWTDAAPQWACFDPELPSAPGMAAMPPKK